MMGGMVSEISWQRIYIMFVIYIYVVIHLKKKKTESQSLFPKTIGSDNIKRK